MLPLIILTGFFSALDLCSGYRLLLIFTYPSRSHAILGEGYVTLLTKAGHDVTYITPHPIKDPPANLRQIDISKIIESYDRLVSDFTLEKVIETKAILPSLSKVIDLVFILTTETVLHKDVQNMIQDPNIEFDAVIVEWMYNEIYAGFAAVFNCPFIWSSSVEPHSMVLSLIDESPNPAYIPDQIMSDSQPPLNFYQRINELFTILNIKFCKLLSASREEETYRNAFELAVQKRGRTLPPLDEIKYNASLMLGNSHASFGLAVRLPENYKPIGGFHISDEVKPLPKDLKRLMDNATNGVIYFSFGTIMQSKKLPLVLKRELLKTFSVLKQTVIWKFEELLPDLPDNVHIVQWAPQQSILAHPNCVLFITHGGLLSITESLHFGVPVIGIPLFADQFLNVKRAISKGFGIGVNMDYDLPKNLKPALKEILENSRYREKVKELSILYHDRLVRPGVELVHWVEHVVRTRGATHLRSLVLMVPWYQKLYLDLIALILLIILLIIKTTKYSLSLLFKTKYDLNKKLI